MKTDSEGSELAQGCNTSKLGKPAKDSALSPEPRVSIEAIQTGFALIFLIAHVDISDDINN